MAEITKEMVERIVFLDVDGVLNNTLFYQEHHKNGTLNSLGFEESNFDPRCMGLLNDLIVTTEAKVVVSSTWRKGRTVEELSGLFSRMGFKGEIIGKTPVGCRMCCRGNEIKSWMDDNTDIIGPRHEFKKYVIFDDDSDMLYNQRANFLLVDPYAGLTPNLIYKANFILTGKYK